MLSHAVSPSNSLKKKKSDQPRYITSMTKALPKKNIRILNKVKQPRRVKHDSMKHSARGFRQKCDLKNK